MIAYGGVLNKCVIMVGWIYRKIVRTVISANATEAHQGRSNSCLDLRARYVVGKSRWEEAKGMDGMQGN